MKSVYVYEEPMDMLKESFLIMKKIHKTTALNAQMAMLDGESPSESDRKLNRLSGTVCRMIEKECPDVAKEDEDD